MKRTAKPMALILILSLLCFLHPQPILAQPLVAQVSKTNPTIHMSPEIEIQAAAEAAEAEEASGSKKGLLWGVLGILAVAGLAAAMVGGAGGGGGDDDPKTGGISASW